MDSYLREFGSQAAAAGDPDSTPTAHAAVLSGVVYGAAKSAGNADIHARPVQEALDYASYTVAAAKGARPGDLPARYFDSRGALMPPDQISDADRIDYSEQLQLYLSRDPVIAHAMPRFERMFNQGAG